MSTPLPPVSPEGPDINHWVTLISQAVGNALQGRINTMGAVTLDANGTTSTLTDANIDKTSKIYFTPTTQNAHDEGIPAVTTKAKGSATLTHTNTADVDKTYDYVVLN